eukprot:gnl/MRDRNA2_/MRDRNA2_73273_c0_seq1.p1 gnl/MRDRNA2_/MRDRNA2_73273_c0~~gnl/MRDRNA2_/MRDRNA2_73273_c0_seq1.p1  ORF type:complete len:344 (+),score=58.74 gnl/MRDRNA2_/MRDRNA2_73273_c0_seq1:78-1109(+)
MATSKREKIGESDEEPKSKRQRVNELHATTGKVVFFINGAPTTKALAKLKDFHLHWKTEQVNLIICASMDTYKGALAKSPVDVKKLPCNFRAPHGSTGGKSPVMFLDGRKVLVKDRDSFLDVQDDISRALASILSYTDANNIPTYFAVVPRDQRLTCIGLVDGQVSFQCDQANSDKAATDLVMETVVQPSFKPLGITVAQALECHTSAHRSHLADVLTIVCATFIDEPNMWLEFALASEPAVRHGIFESSCSWGEKVVEQVPYCDACFTEKSGGSFKSFVTTKSALAALKERLTSLLTNPACKLWTHVFMWHDALLNDVDDVPANHLAKSLAIQWQEQISYET